MATKTQEPSPQTDPDPANPGRAGAPVYGIYRYIEDRRLVRMAAKVPAEPVRWLWKDHLALGKISVVAGESNVGKSLLVAGDFAARVSAGKAENIMKVQSSVFSLKIGARI